MRYVFLSFSGAFFEVDRMPRTREQDASITIDGPCPAHRYFIHFSECTLFFIKIHERAAAVDSFKRVHI